MRSSQAGRVREGPATGGGARARAGLPWAAAGHGGEAPRRQVAAGEWTGAAVRLGPAGGGRVRRRGGIGLGLDCECISGEMPIYR